MGGWGKEVERLFPKKGKNRTKKKSWQIFLCWNLAFKRTVILSINSVTLKEVHNMTEVPWTSLSVLATSENITKKTGRVEKTGDRNLDYHLIDSIILKKTTTLKFMHKFCNLRFCTNPKYLKIPGKCGLCMIPEISLHLTLIWDLSLNYTYISQNFTYHEFIIYLLSVVLLPEA